MTVDKSTVQELTTQSPTFEALSAPRQIQSQVMIRSKHSSSPMQFNLRGQQIKFVPEAVIQDELSLNKITTDNFRTRGGIEKSDE